MTVSCATVPGPKAAIVSFRLGGTDGVAIEAEKWAWALRERGFGVFTVAGEGPVDHLLPGLAMRAGAPPTLPEVADVLADADLVVVENLCSLPLNPAASDVVSAALRGRRALMHHHDLPWQREETARLPPPPDDRGWVHVTINDQSRVEMAVRGVEAKVLRNSFDTKVRLGDREASRSQLEDTLGLNRSIPLLLQPTRAIPRKNVAGGVAFAAAIGATYWIMGPAEDGFGPELDEVVGAATTPVLRGTPRGLPMEMADAYAACDAVLMPSFSEGFGNPSVESAVHRRPLVIGPYPVATELRAFGFDWFGLDDADRLSAWLPDPDESLLERNLAVARRHFALEDLPERLGALFAGAGWSEW